jgi:subtilisin family serine protease
MKMPGVCWHATHYAGVLGLLLSSVACAPSSGVGVGQSNVVGPSERADQNDRLARSAQPVKLQGVEQFRADRAIVVWADNRDEAKVRASISGGPWKLLRHMKLSDAWVSSVGWRNEQSASEAIAALGQLPGVLRVYRDSVAKVNSMPADPRIQEQWAHKKEFANAEEGWRQLQGVDQRKVTVAMIDTGIDVTHEEFQGRVVGGVNVGSNGWGVNDLRDFVGHGTLTAGIMGASANNGKGGAGVAHDVMIMPIKADYFEEDGTTNSFSLMDILAGMRHAIDQQVQGSSRVRVINLSLGENIGGVRPLYAEAVAWARRKGILVVASTGNLGSDIVGTPANTPYCLAVGSTSQHLGFEFVSPFSNYGERLDLVAPGGGILAPIPTTENMIGTLGGQNDIRGYAYASGTSEAAPYVSGVAALVFAKYDPNNASLATEEQASAMVDRVRAHLLRAVDDLGPYGWDPSYGAGRINVLKALSPSSLP